MSNIIVMVFSPQNIVGGLLKKGLQRGGGGSRAPQDPPSYALDTKRFRVVSCFLQHKVDTLLFTSLKKS